MCDTNFNQSEEDFLLSCVHEVIKVWSNHGRANLNISVKNGHAVVQLGFQLGEPRQQHVQPQQPAPPQVYKFKSPAKQEKDRARAAAHRSRILHQVLPSPVKSNHITPAPSSPTLTADSAAPLPAPAITLAASASPLPTTSAGSAAPLPRQMIFQLCQLSHPLHRSSQRKKNQTRKL